MQSCQSQEVYANNSKASKMLDLREALRAAEESRLRRETGYSIDEVSAMMREAIWESTDERE